MGDRHVREYKPAAHAVLIVKAAMTSSDPLGWLLDPIAAMGGQIKSPRSVPAIAPLSRYSRFVPPCHVVGKVPLRWQWHDDILS
jgi:hypothetical protein